MILGERFGQELERHEAMQGRVFCLVDHTHAATAKFFQDAIV